MHPLLWPLFLALLPRSASGPEPFQPDVFVPTQAQQVQRLQEHYAQVVAELTATDVRALTPLQQAERRRLVEVLRDFGACGEFGHNVDFPAARVPHFRDAAGRRCAVAELMHASGEDAFVERVRATRNHVWICDLAGDPEFEAWLDRSGFTIEEAGRIHGPPVIGDGGGISSNPNPGAGGGGTSSGGGPAGGTYSGPGDTVGGTGGTSSGGTAPRGGGTSSGGGGSAPSSKGGGGAATSPSGGAAPSPGAPRPVTLVTTSDDTWWLWWEYNKSRYLRPNRLSLASQPVTGDDPASVLRRAVEDARQSAAALFAKAIEDGDAAVRGTAAIALGRLGGKTSLEKLAVLVGDANVDVRHKAILALGAAGTPEAMSMLLAIARTGAIDPNTKERISPATRSVAIVALALTRRRLVDDRVDVEIVKLIQDRKGSDREPIGVAALVYQSMAPSAELERYALAMAKNEDEAPSVRCRAVESLRTSTDLAVLSELQDFLSGSRLDLRRSAALALGEFRHPLALPALMTAFELEAEPLTRGFVLISIGKQGGEKARNFLTNVLEKGEGGLRRWAALGLGIDARAGSNAESSERIGQVIRAAQRRERNRESMGAYWLALGLARDVHSLDVLRSALEGASDARERMYAASALALIGGEEAARLLRERLTAERAPMARVAAANALGVLGAPEDVPAIVDVLHQLTQPSLQGLAAAAVADSATPAALIALTELARAETGSGVRRAAAIEGLGMILSPYSPLSLADVSCEANYTVFNEWLSAVFQTTL